MVARFRPAPVRACAALAATVRFLPRLAAALVVAGAAGVEAPAQVPPAPNVVAIAMRTPHHGFNRLLVGLTVCAPGTDRCATIDDVMIDTGATGLRLEASAVPDWLRLPPHRDADGRPLAQCVRFVNDAAWGPLHRADLRIGGMMAADLPIQVIDDDAPTRPAFCARSGIPPTSNGTMGLGPWLVDCPGACVQDPSRPGTFACDAGACVPLGGPVPRSDRLPNPASRLAGHDNGIVIALPPAPPGGAEAVAGTLTFGVGTAGNNRLAAASVVRLGSTGRFTTLYAGRAYPDSYIDSGTGTTVVPDGALPRCTGQPWALCVAPERTLAAVIVGEDGARLPMPFTVGSVEAFLASGFGASDSVAAGADPSSRAFVWGAPFFLGKRVAVVMEGRTAPSVGAGPLYAVEDRP